MITLKAPSRSSIFYKVVTFLNGLLDERAPINGWVLFWQSVGWCIAIINITIAIAGSLEIAYVIISILWFDGMFYLPVYDTLLDLPLYSILLVVVGMVFGMLGGLVSFICIGLLTSWEFYALIVGWFVASFVLWKISLILAPLFTPLWKWLSRFKVTCEEIE